MKKSDARIRDRFDKLGKADSAIETLRSPGSWPKTTGVREIAEQFRIERDENRLVIETVMPGSTSKKRSSRKHGTERTGSLLVLGMACALAVLVVATLWPALVTIRRGPEISGTLTGLFPVQGDEGTKIGFIVKLDSGDVVNVKVAKTIPFFKGRRVRILEVHKGWHKSYRFVQYDDSRDG